MRFLLVGLLLSLYGCTDTVHQRGYVITQSPFEEEAEVTQEQEP